MSGPCCIYARIISQKLSINYRRVIQGKLRREFPVLEWGAKEPRIYCVALMEVLVNETNCCGPASWDKDSGEKFQKLLEQIPEMIRGIAEARVSKKAASIVQADNRTVINEKDMVDAFFAETPGGFLGPMKCGMEELGIDYTKYGYSK